MDETDFLVESMYEMDAPMCADFNATDISVNESIFDKRIVGERRTVEFPAQLMFRSPGNVFRDIGNVTPHRLRSTTKAQHQSPNVFITPSSTPKIPSPEACVVSSSRRITRSVSKSSMCTTLTPTGTNEEEKTSPSTHKIASPQLATVSQQSAQEEKPNCTTTDTSEVPLSMHPMPKSYSVKSECKSLSSLNTVSAAQDNTSKGSNLKSSRASTTNLKKVEIVLPTRSSTGKRYSPTSTLQTRRSASGSVSGKMKSPAKVTRARSICGSKVLQPAHSGTPFKGKRSPLKALRMRTKSQDAAVAKEQPFRLRSNSASGPSVQLNTRASSERNVHKAAQNVGVSGPTSMRSRTVSSDLSRLMRPTESTKSKIHNPSPVKRRAVESAGAKPPKLPRNTIPKTPSFLRHTRSRTTPVKSSEDIELEKVAQEKLEMLSLRKMNEQGLRSVTGSGSKQPKGSSMSSGAASGAASSNTELTAKRSIYDELRSTEASSTGNRRFATKDPNPRRDAYTRTVTKPISPKLYSGKRERIGRILSSVEREQQELEKMRQQQFKATPVDRKIFEGPIGLKYRNPPQVTEPLPVNFATDQRMARHAEKQVEPPSMEEVIVRAQPAPQLGPVFRPKLEHKSTNAEPFTFENKDAAIKRKREEMIRQVEEQERKLREFKANPLPPSPCPLPPKLMLAPTVPEPFQLRIDERGQQQQEKFKRMVEAEDARMKEAAVVRAKPADVLKKQPFVPKKETPKITEPLSIELFSEKRAAERREYELRKQEEDAKLNILFEENRLKRERADRRELMKQRQETVIKPEPIKHYKPLQIVGSDKRPTIPISPRFAKSKR